MIDPPLHHNQPIVATYSHSCAVFHSVDHVRLIAAYLPLNDLLTASALCQSLHILFDSEAVWQDRLRQAEAIQHVHADVAVPADAVLSAAQLAALPPLPSLSEVASLCSQSYLAAQAQRQLNLNYSRLVARLRDVHPPQPRLTAIVHLPLTLLYHTRIVTLVMRPRKYTAKYIEFTLACSDAQQGWRVETVGRPLSGWRAINIDDNVGEQNMRGDEQPLHSVFVPATTGTTTTTINSSSKQRYVDLLRCSEHAHNQCYRLLPPSPPRPAANYHRPLNPNLHPIQPLPLCSSCLTLFAHCIARYQAQGISCRVSSVTRINSTLYETVVSGSNGIRHSFRDMITFIDRTAAEGRRVTEEGVRLGGGGGKVGERYKLVAEFAHMYCEAANVCEQCQCGITESRRMEHVSGRCVTEKRRRPVWTTSCNT